MSERLIELPSVDETAALELSFPTSRAAIGETDINEMALNQVRMIIFRSNGIGNEVGVPYLNKVYFPDSSIPDPMDEITISDVVPVGYLNFYLIGNEEAALTPALEAVTSSADFLAMNLDHTSASNDYLKPPFVMYSVFKAVHISVGGVISHPKVMQLGSKYTFPIERCVSKISVSLNCSFANIDNREILIDSALIINLPLFPSLSTQSYAASSYFDTDRLDLSTFMRAKTSSELGYPGITTNVPFVFYLSEHIVSALGRSNFTYLKLVGRLLPLPGSSVGEVKLIYHVPLGNGLGVGSNTATYLLENYATVPPYDLTINRNIHYELGLDINGFGLREAVEVIVKTMPWNPTWTFPIDVEP